MRSLSLVITIVLALFFSVGTAQSLSGQAPARDGFFIGFGVGGGSLGLEGQGDTELGGAGYFKIGGALNDNVLLGAEGAGWSKEMREGGASGTLTFSNLNAVFYGYLDPTGGFFIKSGLGIAVLSAEARFGNVSITESENGVSFTAGVGYDIGFGARFGLTPHVDYHYAGFEDGRINLIRLGLGFNWY